MLVLSRKIDESVIFGPNLTCTATVRAVKYNAVRLLISQVPPDVVLSTKTKTIVSSGEPMEFVVKRDQCLTVEFREQGGKVQISFVESRNDKSRLAIDTPKDWPAHRLEFYDAISGEAKRES